MGVAALTANGQEIGTDVLDLPVGWIAAGAGLIGGAGVFARQGVVALAGGAVALFATGYTLLAIPGEESNYTANGVDVGGAIQVEYAWGVFVLVAAAIALLLSGILLLVRERPALPDNRALDQS